MKDEVILFPRSDKGKGGFGGSYHQQRGCTDLMTVRILGIAAAIAFVLVSVSEGRVTRLVIETRELAKPTQPGELPYEIIRGHFEGRLDPFDVHNRIITDLKSAPRDRNHKVAYSATFAIAKPLDLKHASGVLLYEVANRGNASVVPNSEGHVHAISGWQGDIPARSDLQTATVPIAQGPMGAPIVGPVFARFVDMVPGTTTLKILGGIGASVPRPLPVSLDTRGARLFRQIADEGDLTELSPDQWAYADCTHLPFPGAPDPTSICMRDGFDPHYAYGLVYEGRDPKVLGIGFAATRDLNSFLRYEVADQVGTANPLAGIIRWTVASGTSQSGNFIKGFIHLGFNADERNRIVFDGVNPNIAARQVPLNVRFGVPGGAASLYEAGSEGALWWTSYQDRTRGRGASSLLARCTQTRTCPKIMETFGSAEFWGLHMSPGLIGTDARADVPLPANVRRYYFPGVTHGGSFVGGFPVGGDPPSSFAPKCLLPGNPNPSSDTLRALRKRLVQWVVSGTMPPQSKYPTLAAGDLVQPTANSMGWPSLPNAPLPNGKINPFIDYDFGPKFRYADLSGIVTRQPPKIRRRIPQLVPRVDGDGNETSGVPSVQLLVPLGTYTGWNVLTKGYGSGGGCGFAGGFIPFAKTRDDRMVDGDSRLSLEERYHTHRGFVDQVRKVTASQVVDGWLLPGDAARLIVEAEESDVLVNSR
jgi:hypothetical protein